VDSPSQIAPDEYEARLFGNERYRLAVRPPQAYYLKAFSYNGVASTDLTGFTAVSGSLSILLLILSNHPGVVEAQASPGSFVILWKDGARYDDTGLVSVLQIAGLNGKARFAGLAPGKYRAFVGGAILPTSQDRIDEALPRAKAVTVDKDQIVSVDLTAP
jgi:hypothetical protein